MNKFEKEELIKRIEANATPDSEIDLSDIPASNNNTIWVPFYDGIFKPIKEQVTVRLDKTIVNALKSKGKGWQKELNKCLRECFFEGRI